MNHPIIVHEKVWFTLMIPSEIIYFAIFP